MAATLFIKEFFRFSMKQPPVRRKFALN